ncbi:MAG: hypothetical protein ACTS6G_00415 [Candidatus Hodgkinia cicadicola]
MIKLFSRSASATNYYPPFPVKSVVFITKLVKHLSCYGAVASVVHRFVNNFTNIRSHS